MKEPHDFNFKVGQEAELKSFLTGYRGGWFRFKILDILLKENKIKLKYLDYEDEKIQTAKIYEVPPHSKRSNPSNKQLMIRPCYPLMYHKNTMPPVISEVCVVTDGTWKAEDLVDSYEEGCYWSGRVTKVLSEDKVQIEYPLPPAGEGREDMIYEAFCKDLRPSLIWSQEEGWILPTTDGRTAGEAQLLFPSQQGTDSSREEVEDAAAAPLDGTSNGIGISVDSLVEGQTELHSSEATAAVCEDAEAVGDSPLDAYGTGTSNGTGISVDSLVEGQTEQEAMDAAVCEDVKMDDLESTDSISIMGVQENNASAGAFKEGVDYSIDLNIMHEETLEAPILDLEELANKIRWIKRILHSHQPPSNDTIPWKFA